MKEDAAAKELEHLLRDALNTGLESPRGGTPILQLKTVPLQVQHLPKQAKKPAAPAADAAPNSTPQLAAKLAPDSIPPAAAKAAPSATAKRSSLPALLAVGAFAIAAAGGAAWLAQHRAPVASTASATPTPDPAQASSEGAVGISLAARPAEATAEPPKVDPPTAATTPAPPPTFNTGAEAPKQPEAKVETKPADTKPEAAEAKPKHEAKAHAPSVAPPATAAPKTEAKPEKTADKPAAPASPPAGSVDALLQQQLKGAIP